MDMRSDMMNGIMLGLAGVAVLFAVLESWQHKDYHEKHPDYEPSHTGVFGYVFLAIALAVRSFMN